MKVLIHTPPPTFLVSFMVLIEAETNEEETTSRAKRETRYDGSCYNETLNQRPLLKAIEGEPTTCLPKRKGEVETNKEETTSRMKWVTHYGRTINQHPLLEVVEGEPITDLLK